MILDKILILDAIRGILSEDGCRVNPAGKSFITIDNGKTTYSIRLRENGTLSLGAIQGQNVNKYWDFELTDPKVFEKIKEVVKS